MEMLTACHERIEAQCETLQRLAEHVPLHGCDAPAQQAASNAASLSTNATRSKMHGSARCAPRAAKTALLGAIEVSRICGMLYRAHMAV